MQIDRNCTLCASAAYVRGTRHHATHKTESCELREKPRGTCKNLPTSLPLHGPICEDSAAFAVHHFRARIASRFFVSLPMASHNAHHASGFAAGVAAAVLVAQTGATGPWHSGLFAAFAAGVAGGTAPDWLEVAWWSRKRRGSRIAPSRTGASAGSLLALGWHGHPSSASAGPRRCSASRRLDAPARRLAEPARRAVDLAAPLAQPVEERALRPDRRGRRLGRTGSRSRCSRAPLLEHWLGWLNRV